MSKEKDTKKKEEELKGSENEQDIKVTSEEDKEKGQEEAIEKEEDKDPLEKANEQIAELKDKYLRSVAEFDNYRKRTMKEKAELIVNGAEKAVSAILPVMDDMERALATAEKTEDVEALKEGMKLIFQKFEKCLKGLGVSKIETKDADFNTDYHEAVAMVPGMGDDKKGKVLDCVQTGYTLNDKVIRHAKVAVGQ
ncbi:MAG TPA: nucleotide exchange factor GrpE [Prevotella sp.]|nr:nucleotide exchange factor GrpE [Prevotella sp.]